MKKIAGPWFVALLVSTTAVSLSAQQTTYLRVAGLSPNPGAGTHVGELKLLAFENAGSNGATLLATTGGAVRAGKVSFPNIKVALPLDPATVGWFWQKMALGARVDSVEIRLYNSTGKLFYKTVVQDVTIASVSTSGAEDANTSIEFAFSRIIWFGTSPRDPTQLVGIGGWDVAKVVAIPPAP
jgi:type VI protein secretion system component Hcp